MDKKIYIMNQLSRTNKKNYENYCITRIIHKLDDLSIKFITQQLFRRENGIALADLYFPQFNLIVEVDEAHHDKSKDDERTDEIIKNKISAFEEVINFFNVNLLDSYYRGSGLGSTYAHRSGQGVLLAGPSEKPNHTNVVHEFMHGVLTPIGVKYEAQINSIQYLADKIPYGSKVMASYPNQRAVFDESVIRSLTSLILDQADVVQRETASGFVYTQYFYDNFKSRYPDYTGSFENFMLNLIQDLKAKK